jgi:hypothetical protein
MFHLDKRVPSVLANFVLIFALHKLLVLVFWAAYPFLKGDYPANRNIQMAFDAMSLLILADFLYYWAKSTIRGYPDVVFDEITLVEINGKMEGRGGYPSAWRKYEPQPESYYEAVVDEVF